MSDTRRHIAANDAYPHGGYWQQHDEWTVTWQWVRSGNRLTAFPTLAHRQCSRCGDGLAVPIRTEARLEDLSAFRHTCKAGKR